MKVMIWVVNFLAYTALAWVLGYLGASLLFAPNAPNEEVTDSSCSVKSSEGVVFTTNFGDSEYSCDEAVTLCILISNDENVKCEVLNEK